MLFMVIEHFKNRDAGAVYQRYHERGRMIVDGMRRPALVPTMDGELGGSRRV